MSEMQIKFEPKAWTGGTWMLVRFKTNKNDGIEVGAMLDTFDRDWWPLLSEKVRQDVVDQLIESRDQSRGGV
jgi:hypothetical protein